MRFHLAMVSTALVAGLAVAEARAEVLPLGDAELRAVESEMQSSRALQEQLAVDISTAIAEQEAIAEQLIGVSSRIQSQEGAIAASEAEILRLNKEEVVILSDLAAKQDILSELLAGLQRLEQNPPPALVVEPNDVLSALRGAMLFGAIVPELRDEADRLVSSLARLEQIRAGLKDRKELVDGEMARLVFSRAELKMLIERKRERVTSGNSRLASERNRTAQLAAKATSLKQLLKALAEERQKAEAEAARISEAAQIERGKQEMARRTPRFVFAEAKGRLDYPVQGEIYKRFGDDDGLGGRFHGVAVATSASAQVTAPTDGRVEFAGPFRSYGQVLILNPGSGYHVLLAGMNEITAATGEFLRAGEPVGSMGAGPSSVTLLGDRTHDGRPVLYIEFRNNGEAIDSTPWWIGGVKEARG